MITAAQVQKAFERLATQAQDGDTINDIFSREIEHTEDQYLTVDIEAAGRDAISVGPLVDNGDGSHTMLVTVQVTVHINEDE
jgi:hypothetical protein